MMVPPATPLHLLRGRVMVAPIRETVTRGGIIIPDTHDDDPRHRENQNSLGRGVVVGFGPPARVGRVCGACQGAAADKWHPARCGICRKTGRVETDQEVPRGFELGDEVLFVGQHHSRAIDWDGRRVHMVAQEEIVAVVEP